MAVLKNKKQKNFTMISNSVLCDKDLSMKDKGVLCTICSLPDGWELINKMEYPWNAVKSQFLKLRYQHIEDILNRIVDTELGIKNMSAYLISTLYNASLVGCIEAEASLHDDYLKHLRGKPY